MDSSTPPAVAASARGSGEGAKEAEEQVSVAIKNFRKIAGGYAFDFKTEIGMWYSTEVNGGFAQSSWARTQNPILGDGTTKTFVDAQAFPLQKFYQLDVTDTKPTGFAREDLGPQSPSTAERPFVHNGSDAVLACNGGFHIWRGGQRTFTLDSKVLPGGSVYLRIIGNKLWMLSSYILGPFTISSYLMPTGSGTVGPTPVGSVTYGKATDRLGDFIVTSDQQFMVASWMDMTANRLMFRTWKGGTQLPDLVLPGPVLTPAHIVMEEHPADRSIWFFWDRDSTHEIRIVKLRMEANGPVVEFDRWDILKQEGEFAVLRALPDPIGNRLLFATQIAQTRWYSEVPFRKGAQIGVYSFDVDGSYKETVWPNFNGSNGLCEAISPYAIALDAQGALWMGSGQWNEGSGRFDLSTVRRWNEAGYWETPILMAVTEPVPYYRGGAYTAMLAAVGPPAAPRWFDTISAAQSSVWTQT
jgi:hypothetical protein